MTISMGELIVMLVMGYLIGSCNFAIIYSKLFKKDDIRRHGSGNAGSTNVLRTYGKGPAAAVFLLDLLKGVIAVLIARFFYRHTDICACMAAFGAILGHNFPCYYDFKGGKGVATSFATLLVLDWRLALAAAGAFLIFVLITRYVSVGSAAGSIAAPTLAIVLRCVNGSVSLALCVYSVCVGLLCLLRHKENFKRLAKGTENKLGKKKK
ncbi:MAG: glycerol-3-phosphate 1-O-acyltransferase PlsY [Oscillospiraceae bacterium]|nr:glycerol-3-phosphate 1-O-acyltransferase PlsY [Oscillospiraceae bacterium]